MLFYLKNLFRETLVFKALKKCRDKLRKPHPDTSAEIKNRIYDEQALEVMQKALQLNSVCIDGGAHEGTFLASMNSFAPQARHYAFEPLPYLYKFLRSKFPRHNIFPYALSNYSGHADFKHVKTAPAYSGLRERTYDFRNPKIASLQVKVVRIDDIVPEEEKIAFIKLDLEGGEYHALVGAKNTIRRNLPLIVFEAGHSSSTHYGITPAIIYDFIATELGYQLSTMERWLEHTAGFTRDEFIAAFDTDFFFMAYPA